MSSPDELPTQTFHLPQKERALVDAALSAAQKGEWARRLWAKDATLWTGKDEGQWLGWLDLLPASPAALASYKAIADEVKKDELEDVVLMGMGGSSMAPEVLAATFGIAKGHPKLHILDSTDPAQVAEVAAKVDLQRTLCVVASKSGSTLEPACFLAYFQQRLESNVGVEAPRRIVAITDPGSKLEAQAKAGKFRAIVNGNPSVGGRFSALSPFGLLPAALIGVDLDALMARATAMAEACRLPGADNPGLQLGVALGAMARAGRDKLTIISSPGIRSFGAWLEQLVGESTGKQGKAIIPLDREAAGTPAQYGNDRVIVHVRRADGADPVQDAAIQALIAAGQAVVRIDLRDAYDLGAELFRWEVATAFAGAVLGVNPFDQPDVEASKIASRRLTAAYEVTGSLQAETSFLETEGVKLFSDGRNAFALGAACGGTRTLASILKAHLARAHDGDYVALLAYLPMTAPHEARLQAARHRIRDAKRVATCLGFGPRFLHSTGQAYKGGPSTGVFIQLTCDDAKDLAVPGSKYTFGVVKAAQARGDFEVLAERGRRALRVHLGADVAAGLHAFEAAIASALGTDAR